MTRLSTSQIPTGVPDVQDVAPRQGIDEVPFMASSAIFHTFSGQSPRFKRVFDPVSGRIYNEITARGPCLVGTAFEVGLPRHAICIIRAELQYDEILLPDLTSARLEASIDGSPVGFAEWQDSPEDGVVFLDINKPAKSGAFLILVGKVKMEEKAVVRIGRGRVTYSYSVRDEVS